MAWRDGCLLIAASLSLVRKIIQASPPIDQKTPAVWFAAFIH